MESKGFTLIELIAVTAIFSIVLMTATDIFVSIIKQQRRTLKQQELLNQASYVFEYMGRALRMAKVDDGGNCITAGDNYEITHDGKGVKFINHSDNDSCQEFFKDIDGKLKEIKNGGSAIPLMSNAIGITYFEFKAFGASSLDFLQPRVVISAELYTIGTEDSIKKKIQTTVSQRNLDGS
ncbi:MAG: prepilin-type N-terminal cleavage/methylation domain-containing protein [Candidatus Staskawiczbacteria bacterium]|jgi:prepilin-type N-terminal cleavage/methylation domain-containing protein